MANNQVLRLVGIDFGTSTSVVRVKRYQDGKPIGDSFSSEGVTFGNGESDTKAVTLVRRNADGSLTCGSEAQEQAPDSTIYREFKMDLESLDEEKQTRARDLTEAYFRYLYRWYEHQHSDLGENTDREITLVSFPAKWREETRRFMIRAAEQAGFQNVAAMDEPTAALYAILCRKMDDINRMGLLRLGEPGYLLLVDMGAGTTDLAVCRYTVNSTGSIIRSEQIKNEIIATWPEDASAPTFGGREVDRMLEEFLIEYLQDCGADPKTARQMVTDNSSVKPWKETSVSRALNEDKRVESCAFLNAIIQALGYKKPFPAFGRRAFESMLGDRLEQFKLLVAGCLQHATRLEPEILAKGLDLVVLTGGHSSWYFTEELLNGTMQGLELPQLERVQKEKSRVMRLSNPQETVALGLVYSRLPLTVRDNKEETGETARKAWEEDAKKAGKEAEQQAQEKAAWWAQEKVKSFFRTSNYNNIAEYNPKNADKSIIHWDWDDGIIAVKSDGSLICEGISPDYAIFTGWQDIVSISRGHDYIVGLKKDGTVVATGMGKVYSNKSKYGCNVGSWRNIVSISCGPYHTVGLKKDGTVVAAGYNEYGQCNVEGWHDVVSILCSRKVSNVEIGGADSYTAGLKKDGTVVATGCNRYGQCNVESWWNIASISRGGVYTVGLKRDGTVVATGDNKYGQCNIESWRDIVSISCGFAHTVGLKRDGTVVAAGDNEFGQCNVESWRDIVSISCGSAHTVGLKRDGTVVATGDNECGQCNVGSWQDVMALDCYRMRTMGIRKDGSVIFTDYTWARKGGEIKYFPSMTPKLFSSKLF